MTVDATTANAAFDAKQPSCMDVVDLLHKRIAELEAEVERLQDERWEPVAETTTIEWVGPDGDRKPERQALRVHITRNGRQDIGILEMHYSDEFLPSGELPDHVALCIKRKEARND